MDEKRALYALVRMGTVAPQWGGVAKIATDTIRELTARIAELEEAARWVPVTERLPNPENSESVFVWHECGAGMAWYGWEMSEYSTTDRYGMDDYDGVAPHWHWCGSNVPVMSYHITHWRKPDAPKGEQT